MSPIFSAYIANSAELIPRILDIHLPKGGLVADVTYGLGVFWRKVLQGQSNLFRQPYEIVTSDRVQPADIRADFACLPYRDSTFNAVFLDPPWGNLSSAPRNQGINERYQIQPMTVKECKTLYTNGMRECARILKPKGLLVIKCQDQVCSGRKHWFTVDIFKEGEEIGLTVIDRMIQMNNASDEAINGNENGMIDDEQQHFRARESFYWIMRKSANRRQTKGMAA